LSFDCVFGGAEEGLDTKMLLDPLEKQFDLPTTTVELGNGQCRQCEVVGQKDQSFSTLGIFEPDSSERCIETLARVKDGEYRFGRRSAPSICRLCGSSGAGL